MVPSVLPYVVVTLVVVGLPGCSSRVDRDGEGRAAPSANTSSTSAASGVPRRATKQVAPARAPVTIEPPTVAVAGPVRLALRDATAEDFAYLLASYAGKRVVLTPQAQVALAGKRFSIETPQVPMEVAVSRVIAALEAQGARVTRGSQEIVVDAP